MRRVLLGGLFAMATAQGAGSTAPVAPDAVYALSIAGIPIGEATLSVSMSDDRYVVDGTADVGFLFWGGSGGARSEGVARDGRLVPERYRLTYEGQTRPGHVEIEFDDGVPVRWARAPEPEGDWAEGRTPIDAEDLIGALDPLTALVIPASTDASPNDVCRRLLPVFSGYTRFDLDLTGPAESPQAVGCAATYRPVGGHRPDSRGVARMREPGALSIALAPLSDKVWAPARVAIQTRFGTFEMVRER
jgi:hypothetical protein